MKSALLIVLAISLILSLSAPTAQAQTEGASCAEQAELTNTEIFASDEQQEAGFDDCRSTQRPQRRCLVGGWIWNIMKCKWECSIFGFGN